MTESTGAGSSAEYLTPEPTEEDFTIEYHAWEYLTEITQEPTEYAAYTYVLTGKIDDNLTSNSRFLELIEAVQHQTISTKSLRSIPNSSPNETNLFLIPAELSSGAPIASSELAATYVTELRTISPKFYNEGPFLVVLYEPLFSNINAGKQMLIVDLTQIDEKFFSVAVKTLQEKIENDSPQGIELLRSYRLSLVNSIDRLNSAIEIAFISFDKIRQIISSS